MVCVKITANLILLPWPSTRPHKYQPLTYAFSHQDSSIVHREMNGNSEKYLHHHVNYSYTSLFFTMSHQPNYGKSEYMRFVLNMVIDHF